MSNLGMILLIVFMGLVGGASTLYVVIGLPSGCVFFYSDSAEDSRLFRR